MKMNVWQLRLILASFSIASVACTASQAAKTTGDPQVSSQSATVVIDAGHGGFDRGGIPGQRIPEKEMTLDVAQRLKTVLTDRGYHVIMTRDSDVFVPLPSRDSLPLASAIHYFVAGGAPSANRGVRRRGYYVLRKTRVPAVLVECGFLTNPTEGAYAESASYRQKLAEEIAAGIRGRSSVTSASSSTRAATDESIPLQSYIDQTNVRSKHTRSKHSHKRSSKSKKKKSSKPAEMEASANSE
jgi:N-acetylmuramoyl-L-alanine amidase